MCCDLLPLPSPPYLPPSLSSPPTTECTIGSSVDPDELASKCTKPHPLSNQATPPPHTHKLHGLPWAKSPHLVSLFSMISLTYLLRQLTDHHLPRNTPPVISPWPSSRRRFSAGKETTGVCLCVCACVFVCIHACVYACVCGHVINGYFLDYLQYTPCTLPNGLISP